MAPAAVFLVDALDEDSAAWTRDCLERLSVSSALVEAPANPLSLGLYLVSRSARSADVILRVLARPGQYGLREWCHSLSKVQAHPEAAELVDSKKVRGTAAHIRRCVEQEVACTALRRCLQTHCRFWMCSAHGHPILFHAIS